MVSFKSFHTCFYPIPQLDSYSLTHGDANEDENASQRENENEGENDSHLGGENEVKNDSHLHP